MQFVFRKKKEKKMPLCDLSHVVLFLVSVWATRPDLAKRSLGAAGQAGGERTMMCDRQKKAARVKLKEPGREGGRRRRGWGG